MHRDRGIAEHGFRARRRDHECLRRIVSQRIANMPEIAVGLFVHYFDIGERRFAARAPVDQSLRPIEKLVFPEFDKCFAHRARQPFVHGEALVAPVAGNTQRF